MKIKFVPLQPHCFAFGGFEIQMLQTLKALKDYGVDAEKMDFWEQDDDFDIVHLWGLETAHLNTVQWAKKRGKKVVITTLLNYMETPREKIYNYLSSYFDKVKFLKKISHLSDSIIVLNQKQKEVAIKYYNSQPAKTHIAPIIINSKYYQKDVRTDDLINFGDFVLSTGNVCARKNQYKLAQACIALNIKLLIIGNEMEGEHAYAQKLEKLVSVNENIKWIKGVNAADDLLLEAYHRCAIFALPSYAEVQPTSALEAAVVGRPLLLANKQYAQQDYFKGAALINPASIDDIKNGLSDVLKKPSNFTTTEKSLLKDFKEEAVAKKYLEIYQSVLL